MAVNEKNMTSGSAWKRVPAILYDGRYDDRRSGGRCGSSGSSGGCRLACLAGIWYHDRDGAGLFNSDIPVLRCMRERKSEKSSSKKLCTDSDTFNNCTGIGRSDRSTGIAVFTYSGECYRTEFDVYTNGICRNSNHCSV